MLDRFQILIFRCTLLTPIPHSPKKSVFLQENSSAEQKSPPGAALELAGQAGLSGGQGAALGVQGSVDGSSQVLGCGALCSAAHGDTRALQGLRRGGADGRELDLVDQIP